MAPLTGWCRPRSSVPRGNARGRVRDPLLCGPSNTMRSPTVSLLLATSCALMLGGCIQPKPMTGKSADASRRGVSHAAGEPETATLAQVGKAIETDPGFWNQKGALKIGANGVRVELGELSHKPKMVMHYGNAHTYVLTLFKGGQSVGEMTIWTKKGVHRAQMVGRTIDLPADAVKAGYDSFSLVPRKDDRYAIGGIQLID